MLLFIKWFPFTHVQQVKFEVISHIHKNFSVYSSLFQAFGYKGHTPNNNTIWSGTLNIAVFRSLTTCNVVEASWCIRGNFFLHHQDGSYTLLETAGFCEKFMNSDYFESYPRAIMKVHIVLFWKWAVPVFLKLNDFYSDVNFVVLSGFGCQKCVDVDHIANSSEELAAVVPRVNIRSVEAACSSETVDTLAPFHLLLTYSSKIILTNSLNFCDYFCRS
jgi:hypothetical protein